MFNYFQLRLKVPTDFVEPLSQEAGQHAMQPTSAKNVIQNREVGNRQRIPDALSGHAASEKSDLTPNFRRLSDGIHDESVPFKTLED
jgi:hypothetical protein